MGPRAFARGNHQEAVVFDAGIKLLQWGHVLSHVETVQSLLKFIPVEFASMGPRAFARGNDCRSRQGRQAEHRFNGATCFRTWKQYSCYSLQPRYQIH